MDLWNLDWTFGECPHSGCFVGINLKYCSTEKSWGKSIKKWYHLSPPPHFVTMHFWIRRSLFLFFQFFFFTHDLEVPLVAFWNLSAHRIDEMGHFQVIFVWKYRNCCLLAFWYNWFLMFKCIYFWKDDKFVCSKILN